MEVAGDSDDGYARDSESLDRSRIPAAISSAVPSSPVHPSQRHHHVLPGSRHIRRPHHKHHRNLSLLEYKAHTGQHPSHGQSHSWDAAVDAGTNDPMRAFYRGGQATVTPQIKPQLVIRKEDVEAEKQRNAIRQEELYETYQSLMDTSLDAIQQLDSIHYSILEKFSTIRSTMNSIQELITMRVELHNEFEEDSRALQAEVNTQLEPLGDFQKQREEMIELSGRIGTSTKKAESLKRRLHLTKRRIERREQSEVQWQANVSKRLKIFWGVFGTIAVILLALWIARYVKPPDRITAVISELPVSPLNGSNEPAPTFLHESAGRSMESTREPAASSTSNRVSALQLFDEL